MRRSKRAFVMVIALALTALAPMPTAGAHGTVQPSPVSEFSVTFVDPSRPAGTVSDSRSLPTMIFYPTFDTGFYKTNPLIVFAHGFGAIGPIYSPLLRQLAAQGYVVAAPTFPLTHVGVPGGIVFGDYVNQPGDVSFVITKMLELNNEKSSPVYHRISPKYIGVSGHSLGAITTLGFANSCCDDPRVDALAPISGARLGFPGGSYYSPNPEPTLLIHGDQDDIVSYQGSVNVFNTAPPPKFLVTLLGANHLPFRLGFNPPNPPPPSEIVTVDSLVAFFDLYLNNGQRSLRHLREAAEVPYVATLQFELE